MSAWQVSSLWRPLYESGESYLGRNIITVFEVRTFYSVYFFFRLMFYQPNRGNWINLNFHKSLRSFNDQWPSFENFAVNSLIANVTFARHSHVGDFLAFPDDRSTSRNLKPLNRQSLFCLFMFVRKVSSRKIVKSTQSCWPAEQTHSNNNKSLTWLKMWNSSTSGWLWVTFRLFVLRTLSREKCYRGTR